MGYVNIEDEILDVEVMQFGDHNFMVRDRNREWYVFQDENVAGEAAREYYKDMAENDPYEIICMVGRDTLIQWGLGRSAGSGYNQVSSLMEWLNLWLDTPEELFASYDGNILTGTVSKDVMNEVGIASKNVVFYRHN